MARVGPLIFAAPSAIRIYDPATGASGEIIIHADAAVVAQANAIAVLDHGALKQQAAAREEHGKANRRRRRK